jgi:hypothetical protein
MFATTLAGGDLTDEVAHPASGFNPREPTRYPVHQGLERLLPAASVYAVTCGRHKIVSLHTPMISGGRACLSGDPASKIAVYGWSTRPR